MTIFIIYIFYFIVILCKIQQERLIIVCFLGAPIFVDNFTFKKYIAANKHNTTMFLIVIDVILNREFIIKRIVIWLLDIQLGFLIYFILGI
jgi:hypothetical protein